MQHSPTEIKEKLLLALDEEYNVVDMAAVVEIISILERTPITKEALETTRLGKYVNELRRKTRNESLAKRAKDLVRRWRDMIQNSGSAAAAVNMPTSSHQTNGSNLVGRLGGNLSPGQMLRSHIISPGLPHRTSSPALPPSYNSTNRTHNARTVSPAVSLPSSDKSTSPVLLCPKSSSSSLRLGIEKASTHPSTPTSQSKTFVGLKPESPSLSQARLNPTLASDPVPKTHAENKRLRKESPGAVVGPPRKVGRPNGQVSVKSALLPSHSEFHGESSRDSFGAASDQGSSSCEIISSTFPKVPKDNVEKSFPKKRGRKKGSTKAVLSALAASNASSAVPSVDDIVKEKIASIARTPKVKTTQELLAGLQAKTVNSPEQMMSLNLPSSSENKTSLANCVLPSRGSASDALEMSLNKHEHIAKFLRSQSEMHSIRANSPSSEPSRDDLRRSTSPRESEKVVTGSRDTLDSSVGVSMISRLSKDLLPSEKSRDTFVQSPSSKASHGAGSLNVRAEDRTVEEILARLPPLDPNAICWDASPEEADTDEPGDKAITYEHVDRLHSEHIEGVNGVSHEGLKRDEEDDRFREWHELVSKTSYQGELLHVLPYCVID